LSHFEIVVCDSSSRRPASTWLISPRMTLITIANFSSVVRNGFLPMFFLVD
jgi:hypothetical protein